MSPAWIVPSRANQVEPGEPAWTCPSRALNLSLENVRSCSPLYFLAVSASPLDRNPFPCLCKRKQMKDQTGDLEKLTDMQHYVEGLEDQLTIERVQQTEVNQQLAMEVQNAKREHADQLSKISETQEGQGKDGVPKPKLQIRNAAAALNPAAAKIFKLLTMSASSLLSMKVDQQMVTAIEAMESEQAANLLLECGDETKALELLGALEAPLAVSILSSMKGVDAKKLLLKLGKESRKAIVSELAFNRNPGDPAKSQLAAIFNSATGIDLADMLDDMPPKLTANMFPYLGDKTAEAAVYMKPTNLSLSLMQMPVKSASTILKGMSTQSASFALENVLANSSDPDMAKDMLAMMFIEEQAAILSTMKPRPAAMVIAAMDDDKAVLVMTAKAMKLQAATAIYFSMDSSRRTSILEKIETRWRHHTNLCACLLSSCLSPSGQPDLEEWAARWKAVMGDLTESSLKLFEHFWQRRLRSLVGNANPDKMRKLEKAQAEMRDVMRELVPIMSDAAKSIPVTETDDAQNMKGHMQSMVKRMSAALETPAERAVTFEEAVWANCEQQTMVKSGLKMVEELMSQVGDQIRPEGAEEELQVRTALTNRVLAIEAAGAVSPLGEYPEEEDIEELAHPPPEPTALMAAAAHREVRRASVEDKSVQTDFDPESTQPANFRSPAVLAGTVPMPEPMALSLLRQSSSAASNPPTPTAGDVPEAVPDATALPLADVAEENRMEITRQSHNEFLESLFGPDGDWSQVKSHDDMMNIVLRALEYMSSIHGCNGIFSQIVYDAEQDPDEDAVDDLTTYDDNMFQIHMMIDGGLHDMDGRMEVGSYIPRDADIAPKHYQAANEVATNVSREPFLLVAPLRVNRVVWGTLCLSGSFADILTQDAATKLAQHEAMQADMSLIAQGAEMCIFKTSGLFNENVEHMRTNARRLLQAFQVTQVMKDHDLPPEELLALEKQQSLEVTKMKIHQLNVSKKRVEAMLLQPEMKNALGEIRRYRDPKKPVIAVVVSLMLVMNLPRYRSLLQEDYTLPDHKNMLVSIWKQVQKTFTISIIKQMQKLDSKSNMPSVDSLRAATRVGRVIDEQVMDTEADSTENFIACEELMTQNTYEDCKQISTAAGLLHEWIWIMIQLRMSHIAQVLLQDDLSDLPRALRNRQEHLLAVEAAGAAESQT
ncbi:hypothetical protein CYMTET_8877 [Cymbomonas tetramitiformis]|uniref:Uncharacterized protein n=1 Tax=Cymbomonas tetramitiformis TaxID=36881 RepID=A0AAE0GSK3_9CHLO|nr:hypothetical protein CYMTET_8877 [Cymbomonas tetramitiformis]